MFNLRKRETKLLVSVHGWSGIALGLALYAVVVTGMVAVFAHEIGTWSAGVTRTASPFTQPIDATVRRLAAQTPAKFYEGVDLFTSGSNNATVFFHRHANDPNGQPSAEGVGYEFGADGRVLETRRGFAEEIFAPGNAEALDHFLVDTHVRLHLPNPWGLLLTGILGLAMLVAAISGLLIHRHLFKDIFTLRGGGNRLLSWRDRHSVAGTWSLPFAFALAFTGSFFSFAGSLGIPAMAMVAFGGDQQKVFEAMIGTPSKPDTTPAIVGNLDRVLADATTRAGTPPLFVGISNWGRADATITSSHEPREGGLESVSLVYNGATGAFVQEKPILGVKPSIGGATFAVMGPLHFGNFAGLLSKAVWLGLGFAMCYVTLTGMELWLRRREDQGSLGALDRSVTVVGHGLPLAMVAAALGYFVGFGGGTAAWWTPVAFLIGSAAAIVAGIVLPRTAISAALRGATGVGLLALPLFRVASGGPGWGEVLTVGQPIILSLDVAFALAGAAYLWTFRGAVLPRSVQPTAPVLQAAE